MFPSYLLIGLRLIIERHIFLHATASFNHESPIRGELAPQKNVSAIKSKTNKKTFLGNLYAKRLGTCKRLCNCNVDMPNKKPDDLDCNRSSVLCKEVCKFMAIQLNMKLLWKRQRIKRKCYWKIR